MKLVIDMNLSPSWCGFLKQAGYEAIHWSAVGDARTTDRLITAWAKEKKHVIFTHDLDFGTILAVTKAEGPSVIQVREHDVLPEGMGAIVLQALKQFEDHLNAGALITIDSKSLRARILPIT
jgi:predicted nuclease of predicted toxin-antitoxin system